MLAAVQGKDSGARNSRPARERVFSAHVVELQPADHTPVFTAFGEVRSTRTLDIRATSSGSVVYMDPGFREGGRVFAGQLLLRIDPANAQDALARVEADILEAEAEQREAERALLLARDDAAAVQVQRDLRQAALARQQDLRKRGVGTDATVEIAELAVAAADQSIVSRRQAIAQAEARVDQAATALVRQAIEQTEAKRRLAETEITAAFTGTLSEVAIVEGGLLNNNEQIAQLVDPTQLEVAFRVSAGQFARMLDGEGNLIGADVRVGMNVLDLNFETAGKITRESATVGSGRTGRLLFASVEEPVGLRPGDLVTIGADEPVLRNVARIPSLAVNAGSEVLLVGAEGRLETAKVSVLRRQGDDVLVRAPALYGRQIVAERSPLLGAGIKVTPVVPATKQEGGAAVPAAKRAEPEMIELTDVRREKLVAFVEANKRMPDEARARILKQLAEPSVPAATVERLENRMGG
jgi:multidrug efflux pump subunit AcrA (membrane-fusion protein)